MIKSMNRAKSWWLSIRDRRKNTAGKLPESAERAFIYARSAQVPADAGEQVRMCQHYAERHGMAVVGQVIDAPASGRSDERPGFAALLAAVANGGIDVVLVQDLNRISRAAATLNYFMKLAAKSGVRVIETSACVVRRVHREYAAGRSLEQIARSLNRDGIPASLRRRAS
jgi:predicted site-specific integrase-resolvase